MNDVHLSQRLGWLPDLPDHRDFTANKGPIESALTAAKIGTAPAKTFSWPTKVDLRKWCSPIEDQQDIGSCTAHAGVGLVEYFEKRAFGNHLDASRLFLYKVTRNLLGWTGDTGAFLRSTMGAMVLFGVPPEKYYPYVTAAYDNEPDAFLYSFAQSYQAIKYFRLDPLGTDQKDLLERIKYFLAAGLPSMFGFTVYTSISQADATGEIPFPAPGDKQAGGHAIVAVGYDDKKKIRNDAPVGANTTTGALLIRNSWGTGWGDGGYGYLPYEYVLSGLAVDWWSLFQAEWVATGQFGLEE